MGALWESRGVAGYKTYTSLAGQFNFLVNMFDLATGTHHVMPAAEVTRCRTAAMTTWVAREIVNPGAKKLALFGLGVQGQAHLQALQDILNFQEIVVVDTSDVSENVGVWQSGTASLSISQHPAKPSQMRTLW